MATGNAVLERALIVMAICMAIQTVMFVGAAIGAFIAWRRTSAAVTAATLAAEAQIAELRVRLDHLVATVDDAAHAIIRGASAVDDVVTDARDAYGTVRNSVGNVASVIGGPRAALAMGLWRGIQSWRKRRSAQQVEAAAASEL